MSIDYSKWANISGDGDSDNEQQEPVQVVAAPSTKACWGCGKEPADGVTFSRCERCITNKLTDSFFCSRTCLETHWPRHKKWHKEQKARDTERSSSCNVGGGEQQQQREFADGLESELDVMSSEFDLMMVKASKLTAEKNYRSAVKVLHAAIKKRPDLPAPHYNLAQTFVKANKLSEAAQEFLKAAELCDVPAMRAEATANAFLLLLQPTCASLPKPAWWNDADLLALSEQALSVAPASYSAVQMRATVLSGVDSLAWPGSKVGRAPEQIAESCRLLRRAAGLCPTLAERERVLNQAAKLESAVSETPNACRAAEAMFKATQCVPDTRVRIHGLSAKAEFNGSIGVVLGLLDQSSHRLPVLLLEPQTVAQKKLMLKLENVSIVDPA